MTAERNWWVGLLCVRCGERVKVDGDGRFVQPIVAGRRLGEPWAIHHGCEERKP